MAIKWERPEWPIKAIVDGFEVEIEHKPERGGAVEAFEWTVRGYRKLICSGLSEDLAQAKKLGTAVARGAKGAGIEVFSHE